MDEDVGDGTASVLARQALRRRFVSQKCMHVNTTTRVIPAWLSETASERKKPADFSAGCDETEE